MLHRTRKLQSFTASSHLPFLSPTLHFPYIAQKSRELLTTAKVTCSYEHDEDDTDQSLISSETQQQQTKQRKKLTPLNLNTPLFLVVPMLFAVCVESQSARSR